jgi:hypothetical protein
VHPGDQREHFLESMLRSFAPGVAVDEPIAVPVYGRGRALAVVPQAEIDVPLIEDLSRFLSGPCSCQVKEQNPGFDLPLAVDWDGRLFTDSARPPDSPAGLRMKSRLLPIAVAGPSRSAPHLESPAAADLAAASPVVGGPGEESGAGTLLAIAAVMAGGLILIWSLKPGRAPRGGDGQN